MQSVITRLNGGLGNQMFQYAAGRALADRLGVALKLDLSEFKTYRLRQYELDKFNISAAIATPEEVAPVVVNPSRFWRTCSRLAIAAELSLDKIAFRERKFAYDATFEKISRPVYLNGYWQCEKYFLSVQARLRAEFCPLGKIGDDSRKILDEIGQCNAVSLHIRRGDYVSNPSTAAFHGTCPLEYYHAAIRHLAAHVANPSFFVFSDDPQWARDNLEIGHPRRIVDINGIDRAVEDLWLMQSCQHHIIANSSFSWWAAWLSPGRDKIVIAPRVWFLDGKTDTRDLIPENWRRI